MIFDLRFAISFGFAQDKYGLCFILISSFYHEFNREEMEEIK